MDRWVSYFSLLSYFFTERPLRWGTSSLSYFFSEQLFSSLCAAGTIRLNTSSCNPALWSSTAYYLSRSCYTLHLAPSSCNPARASQHHSCFAARSRANAFQRCQGGLDQTNSGLLRTKVFYDISMKPCSCCSLVHILPTSSPKSAANTSDFEHVEAQTQLSLQSCASRPAPAETQTLQRWPRKPLYPEKHRVSPPRVFSPGNSHASELLRSQLLDDGWLTWWCGWHDDGNATHDNRLELGSFLTNFLWWIKTYEITIWLRNHHPTVPTMP